MKFKSLILMAILSTFSAATNAIGIKDADIVVALDGSGNYTKIQDAINAVKPNQEKRTVIFIKNGLYNTEKLIVPADKKNITLVGQSRTKTIISYDVYDCKGGYKNKAPIEHAKLWSAAIMRTSATITIYGDGFHAENITFQNTAGPVGQALAITVCSDKNVFINCSFLSYQDTIYLWKAGKRSLFKNCLVVGRTDYIYGSGIAFFDACEIRSYGGGWITAPATPKDQFYGFVFYKCKITYALNSPRKGDDGRLVGLGRPWHNYPKVAWIKCHMCKEINPLGWPTTWRMDYASTSPDLHLYEYKNDGLGANMSKRAKWAGLRAMTSKEAKDYTLAKVLSGNDNWNPLKK